MASPTDNLLESTDDYIPPVKLRKTTNEEDHNDLYCFECHDEGDVICCDSCPRVYHPKCLALTTLPDGDWTCPECRIDQCVSKTTNPSTPLRNHSMQEFHTMLKFALRRMKSHPQASPFMQPVDSKQMPEYLDYIIHPMDLETIEKNIDEKKYTSTDAFVADVKWITHNSVVFNGSQSKFTGIARALLKIARHEMAEIEICSECYLRSAQPVSADWFAEPCSLPHTLCWAKMKGYQPWPAKVLRIVNDEVDVRFFGQHDRAWVPISNCLLLSKDYPGVEKKKSNANFEKSLTELQSHIDRLKVLYGQFTYAPLQTPLSKTKPFKFVSIIDDASPPSYITAAGSSSSTLRSSIKCVKPARSPVSQQPNETVINTKAATKRSHESSNEQEQPEQVKRARVYSKPADDTGLGANRIVLRIRKTSEELCSSRSETSNSNGSSHQLTVQIKEPLVALREDDENDSESQSQSSVNMFDVLDSTEPTSMDTKEENETKPTSPGNPFSASSASSSPSETKLHIDTLLNEDEDRTPSPVDSNDSDVRLTMSAVLDMVDALKTISHVHTNGPLGATSTGTASSNPPVPAQPQFAERRTTTKQPRKSRLQHRIVTPQPKPTPANMVPLVPFEQPLLDQVLSPTSAMIPLRPLSISPASMDTTEEIGSVAHADFPPLQQRELERTTSIETLSVKSEPMDNDEQSKRRVLAAQPTLSSSSSLSTKSFLISPPAQSHHHRSKTPTASNAHFPPMIANSNTAFAPRASSNLSQKTTWPAALSINAATRQPPITAQKRPAVPAPVYPPTAPRNSNATSSTMRMPVSTSLQPQSFDAFPINPTLQRRPNGVPLSSHTPPMSTRNPVRMPSFPTHSIRPPLEDHQTPGEVQIIIKTFNDKFQQLLTDFTVKIESALEANRVKYEKELEETRRSYRVSLNELRTITTQQVQEMHNSLELQYWTRISDMRNRYESTLQQQSTKAPKSLNGTPR